MPPEAAPSGVDLSFVQHLAVSMTGIKGGIPVAAPVEVAEYDQATASPPQTGPVLDLHISPPAEVNSVWQAPASDLDLELRGALPGASWTVDVTVRLSATIEL